MKWCREQLRGTGRVFQFSLSQQMKSKVNLMTFLLLFLLAAGSVPFLAWQSGGRAVKRSDIQAVYVENDTPYALAPEQAGLLNRAFADTEFLEADFSVETYEQHLAGNEVLAVAGTGEAGYQIDLYTREDSGLELEDLAPLEDLLTQLFENARMEAAGASAGQIGLLGNPIETDILSEEEYRNPREENWEAQFVLQYAYAVIVMILCLLSSSYVVRSIAEEKASKLVEMLMVSVRPLSLLAGKVLAMMVYTVVLIGSLLVGAVGSWFVTGRFMDLSGVNFGAMLGLDAGGFHLDAGVAAAAVICILLGYLTFSMMAGLSGCCCASMDDVEGANMAVVLLVMAGYLVSCVTAPFLSGPVCTVMSLIPLVSVFCAPVQYAMGHIGIGILALSWLFQAAVILGLAVFSARVYNSLLIFRGRKVGMLQLLAMAGRKEGK